MSVIILGDDIEALTTCPFQHLSFTVIFISSTGWNKSKSAPSVAKLISFATGIQYQMCEPLTIQIRDL